MAQGSMMRLQFVFTLFTKHRAFVMQAVGPCVVALPIHDSFFDQSICSSLFSSRSSLQERQPELDRWIEAFDPLLAGSILSRHGQKKR
jgi:hypothetical protein